MTLVILTLLLTKTSFADRRAAEKFFSPDIKAIESSSNVEISRLKGKIKSKAKRSSASQKSKNAMIGFSFGVNHLNSSSGRFKIDGNDKSGWGANLSFINRKTPSLFDSIYQIVYGSVSQLENESQASLGAVVQWAWPKLDFSPVYAALGLGGDHQFGNSNSDNEWGLLFKGSMGLRLQSKRALFSLEVSRNSRVSVLTQETDHYWSILSGIAILY